MLAGIYEILELATQMWHLVTERNCICIDLYEIHLTVCLFIVVIFLSYFNFSDCVGENNNIDTSKFLFNVHMRVYTRLNWKMYGR